MLIIRVEMHSNRTGKVTELARAKIFNTGEKTGDRCNYHAVSYRGRDTKQLNKLTVSREGDVHDYPRNSNHVWCLVARALRQMGYQ